MRNKTPEFIDIDHSSAGFSVVSDCPGTGLMAKLHRAGSVWVTNLSLEFNSYLKKGALHTFVLPNEFWAFNTGMYDVDIYCGTEYLKTVRLRYMMKASVTKANEVKQENGCETKSQPATGQVVPCDIDIEGCPEPSCKQDWNVDPACSGEQAMDNTANAKTAINNASVSTNEDLVKYVDDLVANLDLMVSSGFYYSSKVPLDAGMQSSIADLKTSLEAMKSSGGNSSALGQTILMQSELQALTAQISANMATAVKQSNTPLPAKIQPNPPKRILEAPEQKLADKIQEAFANG